MRPVATLIAILSLTAFLPILVNDARLVEVNWDWHWNTTSVVILLASICRLRAALGYLTPGVVDEYSAGSPEVAGRAYAVNVLGRILEPPCPLHASCPCSVSGLRSSSSVCLFWFSFCSCANSYRANCS